MGKILTSFVLLSLLVVGGNSQPRESAVPADFKSDGCSLFPDGNYRECCVEHDKAYYVGGSLKERRAADKELYGCVRSKGNSKFLSSIMYIGVRVGGVSFLPTPFRWGFGNKFPRKQPKKPKDKTPTDR